MSIPFQIDAAKIIDFQSCKRRYLLSKNWRQIRWSPKLLFDSCLRQALVAIGEGKKVNEVISDTNSRYMTTGANYGLDVVGLDPFIVASDYVAMLETVIMASAKRNPMRLREVKSISLSKSADWVFLSNKDDNGELHRTITVDRWDDDRLSQEIHSWYVFGDVAASKKPMHLHVIEIGQIRDGRRHSPWARAWQHEYIKGQLRFQKKSGSKLEGTWKPIYLSDSDKFNSEEWVEYMENDGIIDSLIHHVDVVVPNHEHIKDFRRQVLIEAKQMQEWEEAVVDPRVVPMSRNACDSPYPCRFQAACFSPVIDVDISSLGVYKAR